MLGNDPGTLFSPCSNTAQRSDAVSDVQMQNMGAARAAEDLGRKLKPGSCLDAMAAGRKP